MKEGCPTHGKLEMTVGTTKIQTLEEVKLDRSDFSIVIYDDQLLTKALQEIKTEVKSIQRQEFNRLEQLEKYFTNQKATKWREK